MRWPKSAAFLFLSRQKVVLDWICAEDNTNMRISEEGRLKCNQYWPHHDDKIINWKFDCGDRSYYGPHRSTHFQSPDYEGFSHAMAIAVANSTMAGAEWVTKLILNLKQQFGRD